jgi:hypothetical protein
MLTVTPTHAPAQTRKHMWFILTRQGSFPPQRSELGRISIKWLASLCIDGLDRVTNQWSGQPFQQDAAYHTLDTALAVMLAQLGNINEQSWLFAVTLDRIIDGLDK